jgi:hypothetical protein
MVFTMIGGSNGGSNTKTTNLIFFRGSKYFFFNERSLVEEGSFNI